MCIVGFGMCAIVNINDFFFPFFYGCGYIYVFSIECKHVNKGIILVAHTWSVFSRAGWPQWACGYCVFAFGMPWTRLFGSSVVSAGEGGCWECMVE